MQQIACYFADNEGHLDDLTTAWHLSGSLRRSTHPSAHTEGRGPAGLMMVMVVPVLRGHGSD